MKLAFSFAYEVFETQCVFYAGSTSQASGWWPPHWTSQACIFLLKPFIMGTVFSSHLVEVLLIHWPGAGWVHVVTPGLPPPTIGAFNDREALERFHRRAAHVQDDLHGIPSLPQQGLGAQARTQVWNRFA